MAKKGFGKLVTLAAFAGIAAAGISYMKKYQSFSKELDEDFHDFEDEDEAPVPDNTMNRKYVALNADKDELLVAAGDMLNAAKDAAGAAKNVIKDAASIVADTTRDAVSAAADTTSYTKSTLPEAVEEMKDAAEELKEGVKEDFEEAEETIKETIKDAVTRISEDEEF